MAAQQQLAANRARVDNTTLENHPQVRDAAAAVRNAYLTLSRTELPAPVSGFVARRNVQLGQRVGPGSALMAVVPLDEVWVDANFKEPQMAHMRVGQPVTLTADLYGAHVVYHGKVAGFGAGTGAAFSLLPAQNATGNWIKIVQRVPVRVALDPRELVGPSAAGWTVDEGGRRCQQRRRRRTPAAAGEWCGYVDGGIRFERCAGGPARAEHHRGERERCYATWRCANVQPSRHCWRRIRRPPCARRRR